MRGVEVGGMHACYEENGVPYRLYTGMGGWAHTNEARARSKGAGRPATAALSEDGKLRFSEISRVHFAERPGAVPFLYTLQASRGNVSH